jgi:serine/threonine protein kinase
MNYNNKYLKYKQKYLNFKKIIGGGVNATYNINSDNILTISYDLNGEKKEEKYKIIKVIGKGFFGSVELIQDEKKKYNYYIFKRGIDPSKNESYNEGIKSEMLKYIIDSEMLPLFQGNDPTDFLISRYNGKNLIDEFQGNIKKIKDNFFNVTNQTLDLITKINKKNLFHNDIKPENLTIMMDKVYLIDFGQLDNKSNSGSLVSMSFKSLIFFCQKLNYNRYAKSYNYLNCLLKNTDIFGFFYVCLDLLFLLSNNSYNLIDLLDELNIDTRKPEFFYVLFKLYYFILPQSKRIIPNLNVDSDKEFNDKLPNSDYAKSIFGNFPLENINLFRYMSLIYNKLNYYLNSINFNDNSLKQFLKVISDCLLPDFNYDNFKPKYLNSVILLFEIPPIITIDNSYDPTRYYDASLYTNSRL